VKVAGRITQLGTETAFAVSARCADWQSRGNRVYPFHLGDINLPTPPNIIEAMDRAVADGRTGYCPAAGVLDLRIALAEDVGSKRGLEYGPQNVVVQPGGKPVITKFIQAVMDPGDEVLYPNPGYPIYESQIEYFGGVARPYRYLPTDDGFAIDVEQIRSMVGPRTKAIIYNDLQNPTGAESSALERQAIADIARDHDLWVLSDEAYFEVRFAGSSDSIASLPGMQERTVILYTFSKKFAMTGWRLGAAVAPERIAEVIGRLNVNDESCTTHFVQYGGIEAILGDQSEPMALVETLRRRRDATVDALSRIPGVTTSRPRAGFYVFPDVAGAMEAKGIRDLADFAEQALVSTGVSFCTRRHFGRSQPDEQGQHIRLAFSGIDESDIEEGLARFGDWVEAN
jgi:aspartate/methionine/tyrosine aminotransferase